MPASDPSPRPNELLSHYRLLGRVGEGGMGVLFRARDTRLDRTVALKLLRGAIAVDEEHRRRFLQEARAASALNHPNIVTIYDIDREPGPDGAYFIVARISTPGTPLFPRPMAKGGLHRDRGIVVEVKRRPKRSGCRAFRPLYIHRYSLGNR